MSLADFGFGGGTAPATPGLIEKIGDGYRVAPRIGGTFHRIFLNPVMGAAAFGSTAWLGVAWWGAQPQPLDAATMSAAVIAAAVYLIAVSVYLAWHKTPKAERLELDRVRRVLRIGTGRKTRVLRFEELSRIDLVEDTGGFALADLLSTGDRGSIVAEVSGRKPVILATGELSDLERLLCDLRSDTGTY